MADAWEAIDAEAVRGVLPAKGTNRDGRWPRAALLRKVLLNKQDEYSFDRQRMRILCAWHGFWPGYVGLSGPQDAGEHLLQVALALGDVDLFTAHGICSDWHAILLTATMLPQLAVPLPALLRRMASVRGPDYAVSVMQSPLVCAKLQACIEHSALLRLLTDLLHAAAMNPFKTDALHRLMSKTDAYMWAQKENALAPQVG